MLTAEQLLDDVCSPDPVKVAAALQAAHGRGAELIPGLVARMTDVLERPEEWTGDRNPVFLLFLAAEFRESRVHELLTRMLRLSDDLPCRLKQEFTKKAIYLERLSLLSGVVAVCPRVLSTWTASGPPASGDPTEGTSNR